MSFSEIIAVAACSAITAALVALAWAAGWRAGYWKRVEIEKDARGIR